MAGGKKKKKPASNPARGFATTSVASKPRSEVPDTSTISESSPDQNVAQEVKVGVDGIVLPSTVTKARNNSIVLTSPEDFEMQLEESELQVLVEKYSQKSKRDAGRQISRLLTDRRLLRGQAETLSTRKWLPSELIDEILDLIVAESHIVNKPIGQENPKNLSKEDLTIRLWTLKQTLEGAGFPEGKVQQVLEYVLEISEKVLLGNKDSIWGLEESMDWLARECSRTELPDYESWGRKPLKGLKSHAGMFM
jgi:ATP-dependent RNA helicase DHX29